MAWMYAAINIFDFVIAPTLWGILQQKSGLPLVEWLPLTLQGGGMFHLAMGGVIGVTAYTRGKEKATPWAMLGSLPQTQSFAPQHPLADGQPYVNPEKRFG